MYGWFLEVATTLGFRGTIKRFSLSASETVVVVACFTLPKLAPGSVIPDPGAHSSDP